MGVRFARWALECETGLLTFFCFLLCWGGGDAPWRWCGYGTPGVFGGARLTFLCVLCSCSWNGYFALPVSILALRSRCGFSFPWCPQQLPPPPPRAARLAPVPGHASPLVAGRRGRLTFLRGSPRLPHRPRCPRASALRVYVFVCVVCFVLAPLACTPQPQRRASVSRFAARACRCRATHIRWSAAVAHTVRPAFRRPCSAGRPRMGRRPMLCCGGRGRAIRGWPVGARRVATARRSRRACGFL